jgi:hypothetical protein
MTDFFSALELELRAASTRRPRRRISAGPGLGAVAAAALLAAAVLIVAAVAGGGDDPARRAGADRSPDPVGAVIPRKDAHTESDALVVANGTARGIGPWQMEVSRTSGERDTNGAVMWHRGYCLWIRVLRQDGTHRGRSGFCGGPRTLGFRRTPGFSRSQTVAVRVQGRKPSRKPILVWGRVPDRADRVVITAPGGKRIEAVPQDGPENFPGRFYGIPVKPPMQGARINWLDANGQPGSRGIALMPPISR